MTLTKRQSEQLQSDVVNLEFDIAELVDECELEIFRDWDHFTDDEMRDYLVKLLNIRVDLMFN